MPRQLRLLAHRQVAVAVAGAQPLAMVARVLTTVVVAAVQVSAQPALATRALLLSLTPPSSRTRTRSLPERSASLGRRSLTFLGTPTRSLPTRLGSSVKMFLCSLNQH